MYPHRSLGCILRSCENPTSVLKAAAAAKTQGKGVKVKFQWSSQFTRTSTITQLIINEGAQQRGGEGGVGADKPLNINTSNNNALECRNL